MRDVPSGKRNSLVEKKCAGSAPTVAYQVFQKSFMLSSGGPISAEWYCTSHGHSSSAVRPTKKTRTAPKVVTPFRGRALRIAGTCQLSNAPDRSRSDVKSVIVEQ